MSSHPISTTAIRQTPRGTLHYYLRWPPPGLERHHAAAWPVILALSTGSALLVLPQLIMLTAPTAAWSLGPFEPVWALPIICAALGILLVVGSALRLAWLLAAGARSAKQGYGWITFLQVAADATRDTGFIIQGARHFATLDDRTRRRVLVLRLLTAGLYMTAALWPLAGFVAAYLLSIRGHASPQLLWLLPLLPTALLMCAGLGCRVWERVNLRAARQKAASRTETPEELRCEIDEWNARLADEVDAGALPGGSLGAARIFRGGGFVAVAVALLAVLPVGALAVLATIGPLLSSVALPGYGSALTQLRMLKLYDEYRLPSDPSITPSAAGDALHVLAFVGVEPQPPNLLRAPARQYAEALVPQSDRLPSSWAGVSWGPALLAVAADSLSAEQRRYLEEVAAQPYHADIALFARAPAADIAGSRWHSPMPLHLAPHEWPLPGYAALRQAFHAHYAVAALALADGRYEDGEFALRAVLTSGLRLAEDGVTLADGIVGASIAQMAAHMLREYYELSGRPAAAARLDATLDAAELARSAAGPLPVQYSSLATLPPLVLDSTIARSLRWEIFATLNSIEGCLTPKRAVLGTDRSTVAWQERTRRGLVRYPSDAERFTVIAKHGQFGRPAGAQRSLPERLITAAAGRPAGIPGCSEVLAALSN
jgi:hypothetical protein